MKWKDIPIPELEGWQASTTGLIRTLNFREPRLIRQRLERGYYEVTKHLGTRPNGSKIKKRYPVHRLVLFAFRGSPPPGTEGIHRNSIKTDNRPCNLEWGTRKRNARDLYNEQGYTGFRLDRDQALSIKYLHLILKVSRREVAETYGVSESAVYLICSGKVWKELC